MKQRQTTPSVHTLKAGLAGLAGLLLAVCAAACTALGGKGEEKMLGPEEIRVAESRQIDTTSLPRMATPGGATLVATPDSVADALLLDELSAQAWILVADSSGLLLSEKQAGQRMFPASLTKMMTSMLALETGRLTDSVRITEDVFLAKDSRVRLGDAYLLGNMIREMMLQSDNDAAYALAKHLGGDIPSFCQLMNEKAAYLGMDSTHFDNPNGMPSDSTYSSARDLLVLTRYCMRDSSFSAIAGTAFSDIPLLDGRHLPCQNTNLLLESYDGCIGVKTGFTRRAGYCLASAARRNGQTLFLVLLGSKSHTSRFTESAALLDYGFRVLGVAQ